MYPEMSRWACHLKVMCFHIALSVILAEISLMGKSLSSDEVGAFSTITQLIVAGVVGFVGPWRKGSRDECAVCKF